ncbi:hypothetical protein RE476_02845 [Methanolobus mangrovi]|uniref:Uncharacterized protein n=1 Tax=Methanolobus mangrovi TaxID=3072977 RepID=A0AA51UIJ5_9EURY|nr:hypothetical protein [Methanolobus mangrovi]WMW22777.1 hypothetical protein RE476_02845 [Methanolobus mangrovi]
MPTTELFNGIAIIIDDEIGKESKINNIINQIEEKNIPCVKYTQLPDPKIINHLQGVSFLLLDWTILTEDLQSSILDGVKIPDELKSKLIDENISFLKSLMEKCFAPVFIFSNESPSYIISKLKENDLYSDDKPNFIFVKRKSDIDDDKLFAEINSWIQTTPSIYALKAWEKEYGKAKNLLFLDFYNMSHSWPTILWNNFENDGVNTSRELGEIISRNLHTRMTPFSFHEDYLDIKDPDIEMDEIRKVIEGERFISNHRLHSDSILAGDVFGENNKEVYLNIRPDCDCIPDRSKGDSTLDDVKLYLIRGDRITFKKESDSYIKRYGNFSEQENTAFVFSMIAGRSYVFRFKDILIADWKDYKDKRIGRLLPPHITRIQQRYSFYLQRQGLPRTPEVAVNNERNSLKEMFKLMEKLSV